MASKVYATAHEGKAPRVIVEVMTSSLAGRRFPFTAAELRKGVMLGRAPDCHVRFDPGRDLKVSGHHALLEERDDGIFLRDQGSSNGLYANRRRATAEGTRVYDACEISLGQEGALLRLVIPGDPEPVTPKTLTPPKPGEQDSLHRVIDELSEAVGAGDKTRHIISEVAQKMEARAARRRASLITVFVAFVMLVAAAAAIGVWYFQHGAG